MCVCVYVYIYIHTYIHTYIHVYMFIFEREKAQAGEGLREREGKRGFEAGFVGLKLMNREIMT